MIDLPCAQRKLVCGSADEDEPNLAGLSEEIGRKFHFRRGFHGCMTEDHRTAYPSVQF